MGALLGALALLPVGCRSDPVDSLHSAEAGEPPAHRAVPVEVLRPVAGSRRERELPAGAAHAYTLSLPAGAFVELRVEQQGADVVLTFREPGGDRILVIDSPNGAEGSEVLRAVTGVSGDHRLEIDSAPWLDQAGRYRLSLEALRPASQTDRRRFAGDRLFARAEQLREAGDPPSVREAIEVYGQARAVAIELEDRLREAETHAREAWILRKHLDRKSASVEPYRRAVSLYRELGLPREEANVQNNLGRVYYDLGEMGQALACYRRALLLWRQAGDAAGEASTINNLGLVYVVHGDIGEALTFFEEAVGRIRSLELDRDEARVLNNRGRFYLSIGKEREALDDLTRARQVAERSAALPEQVDALSSSAEVHLSLGELETARRMLETALALQRRLGGDRGIAKRLFSLAAVDASTRRTEVAIGRLQEALRLFRRLEARRQVAATLSRLGWLLVESQRAGQALALLDEALAAYEVVDEPAGEALALLSLARARRQLGEPHASLQLGLRGLDRIEQVRGGADTHDLKSAYFAAQQDHYDFVVDLLMELHRREPTAGYHLAALEVSERSRARSLLESLSTADRGPGLSADRRLQAREQETRDRLAALETELAGGPPTARAAEIERRVRRRLRALDRIYAEMRDGAARAPAAGPLTAAAIQRDVVDAETVLLEYDLGLERSYVWLVEPQRVSVFELPPRSVVEAAARRAHRMLIESRRREAAVPAEIALAELSEIVLAPVADRLDARRLVVVGDGALLYVPFAALPLPTPAAPELGEGRVRPLLAEHEVVQSASASTAALLSRRLRERPVRDRRVAVLADPVFSRGDSRLPAAEDAGQIEPGALPRLVHSPREADTLRQLVAPEQSLFAIGTDASRELVTGGELAAFGIVHFATHGELNSEHPELSRLVLSRWAEGGRPVNGLLFAHEIHRLELSADLVVLSACKTALGVEVRGEGLMGLTQSFLAAGAGGVVVSLWQVDDRATAELMSEFYRELLIEGLAPSAALRSAQRSIRERAAWRAPYYWAGFVFQGAD